MRSVTLIAFLVLLTANLRAQELKNPRFMFGIKLAGLSAHFKPSPHPHLYKGRIDKKGLFVLNQGVVLSVEYYFHNQMALRATQAFLWSDCAGRLHAASHIGLSFGHFFTLNHEVRMSFGPMFFYRKSWHQLPGYQDYGLFKLSKNEKWQRKFVWHGLELEYNYFKNNTAYNLAVLPGIPEVLAIAGGFKYR